MGKNHQTRSKAAKAVTIRRLSDPTRPKQKAPRTAFKPGQSGNPKGRPPLPKDYKIAMERIGPEALAALDNIIHDPTHPRHEHASEYIVNRWKGTPTVKVEAAGPGGGPIEVRSVRDLSSGERRKRIDALVQRRAEVASRLAAEQAAKQAAKNAKGSDSEET